MLFNLQMGRREELILSTVHLNCLPNMQCHSNMLTNHIEKHVYVAIVSRTVPFIRVPIHEKLEEAVSIQKA